MSSRERKLVPDLSDFAVKLKEVEPKDMEKLREELGSLVIGQERAVDKVVKTISLYESGLHDKKRALPVLFFAGLSGVGKTHLARMAAEKWIGEPQKGQTSPLVIVSGENYLNEHAGDQLLGSPPGYVGYNNKTPLEDIGAFEKEQWESVIVEEIQEWYNGIPKDFPQGAEEEAGQLIQNIIGNVYQHYIEQCGPFRSVLLIDEFEKMHPSVQKQFLTIFSRGEIELRNGQVIDLRSCLIILTSNIGTGEITNILHKPSVGFSAPGKEDSEDTDQKIYNVVKKKIQKVLPPELYGRIGHEGIVIFHQLARDDYLKIIELEIKKIQKELSGEDEAGVVSIHIADEFYEFILKKADAHQEGARQIERLIDKHVREPLARQVAGNQLRSGDQLLFTVEKGKTTIYRTRRPTNPSLPPLDAGEKDVDEEFLREKIANDLDDIWEQVTEQLNEKYYETPSADDDNDEGYEEDDDLYE